MEWVILITGLVIIGYINSLIQDYKAKKLIPSAEVKIEELTTKLHEYEQQESYIYESVENFRRECEHRTSQRAYFAKKKSRKSYR